MGDTDDDGSGLTGTVRDVAWVVQLEANIDAAIAVSDAAVRTVATGGTGAATLAANGIVYGNGTSAVGVTAVGTATHVLTSNGAGVAPTFQAAAGGGSPTEQTTTATGAQANFNLSAAFTFLRCTGAAPVFSGFTVAGGAPSAGDRVLISCLGTTAKVTTQGAGSTEANRIIAPSTNGQIVGVNGLMLLVYDATTARWRESVVEPGAYINVTYASGDFTGNDSMTWTVDSGDLVVFSYQQRGNNLHIVVGVEASSVGGTPSSDLQIAFPAGFAPTYSGSSTLFDVGFGIDNGTLETVRISAASTTINAIRIAGTNWAASTNTTRVYVNHMFTVQ